MSILIASNLHSDLVYTIENQVAGHQYYDVVTLAPVVMATKYYWM